jgi:energy-coupling factor transport system permease protein
LRAFGKVHPLPLFTYFIVMLLFSMFLRNPVIVLLSLLGGGAFAATLTDKREKLSDLKFYIPLSVLIAVTNPLYSHNGRTPLFFVNGNAFTLEAVAYGVFIAAMIIAVLLWSKSYSKIVTGDKFLYLFGRVTPKTALILSVALRYVPILKRQAQKTRETQKTLGLFSTGSVADNLVSGAKVYSALVGWSLENAVETGRHMRSRGWGHGKRTSFSVFRFRVSDGVLLGFTLLSAVLLGLASSGGALRFSFYPTPTPLPLSALPLAAYVCFGALAFLPFLIETEENIRWTCLRSKI